MLPILVNFSVLSDYAVIGFDLALSTVLKNGLENFPTRLNTEIKSFQVG